MKATLKIISLLALSSGLASAASTVLSAYYDTSFRTSEGVLLDSGFTAYIGTTSATEFSTTDDYASILATWTSTSNTAVAFSTSAGDFDGYFTGTFTYSTQPGQVIVLWVTDGADQNFVAKIDQVFANDANAPFNSNTYDIQFSLIDDLDIMLGSFAAGTDGFGGTGGNLILNNSAEVIPEPSAALLGALGALALLRRRRI